jgi:DNA-binding MarR family transcriptional regulator
VKPLKEIYHQLDILLHEPGRLAIVATLAPVAGRMTFVELRDELRMTDGNLCVHLRKLEDKGYVDVEKKFVGRRPQSSYCLTKLGRKALTQYLDQLEAILKQGREKAAGA